MPLVHSDTPRSWGWSQLLQDHWAAWQCDGGRGRRQQVLNTVKTTLLIASREGTSCQCPKADVCKALFAFALAVDRIKFLMVKDGECPPLFTSHWAEVRNGQEERKKKNKSTIKLMHSLNFIFTAEPWGIDKQRCFSFGKVLLGGRMEIRKRN